MTQKQLPFESEREAKRQERLRRIFATVADKPARYFDYHEATSIALASNRRAGNGR